MLNHWLGLLVLHLSNSSYLLSISLYPHFCRRNSGKLRYLLYDISMLLKNLVKVEDLETVDLGFTSLNNNNRWDLRCTPSHLIKQTESVYW